MRTVRVRSMVNRSCGMWDGFPNRAMMDLPVRTGREAGGFLIEFLPGTVIFHATEGAGRAGLSTR